MRTNEELATAIQNGEDGLMYQLWDQCQGFIRQQALKWAKAWHRRSHFDMDDLTQAGYCALCEAVRGYQVERGMFLTFLGFRLKTEFAKVVGCRTESQLKDPINEATSLDAPVNNDTEDITLGESIPVIDPGFEDVEDAMVNQQLAKILDQALQELPEKQRKVIELYYLRRLSFIQIAEILHCSASFPQQCSRDGLRNLRKCSFADTLSEILYGERNYYKHTGYSSWKSSGCSSPEWELLKKEDAFRWRTIRYCVEDLGMTVEKAKRLFPES